MSAGTGSVQDLQRRACGFYGFPGSKNRPVGEVHYVNEWLGDQMTRLDWDVLIDGSEVWSVTLADGQTISTTRTDGDGEPT